MAEAKEKKPPLDREEFKLLSVNERRFIENPTDLLKDHKSPDAMARQYNNRIKYRAINAITEVASLCAKLPEDRLKKILTDDRIIDIIKIFEKALGVADWKLSASLNILEKIEDKSASMDYYMEVIEESKRVDILKKCIKNLMPHCLRASEITSFEELIKKYNGFLGVLNEISTLNTKYYDCLSKTAPLTDFIKYKGLEKELESFQKKLDEIRDANFKKHIEYIKTPAGREEIKSKNKYTDEQIDIYIKFFG